MSHTAPNPNLTKLNLEYMTLMKLQHKQKAHFIFDPVLQDRITWVRNDLIELQAAQRKEVIHTA